MLSRVADNLYWMSRYLERAEHTARLVDVNLSLSLEQSHDAAGRRWQRVLSSLRARSPQSGDFSDAEEAAYWLIFNTTNANSLAGCVRAARENARQVREQISTEMWEHINRLYLRVRQARETGEWNENLRGYLSGVTETCHLIQGVTDATLSHGEGWHFIRVGQFIERASNTASLLNVQFRDMQSATGERYEETDTYLDWVGLLNSCAAFDAYRKVYTASLRPERIAEFLVLNGEFPHSIAFSAQQLETALRAIARSTRSQRATRVNNLAHRMRSTLQFSHTQSLLIDGLQSHLRYVLDGCGHIHNAIHQAYIVYPVEEELAA
jgi:uncharacterized alpha-E superfamily protein